MIPDDLKEAIKHFPHILWLMFLIFFSVLMLLLFPEDQPIIRIPEGYEEMIFE